MMLSKIMQAVKTQSEEELNNAIQAHLTSTGRNTAVTQWRLEHWEELRQAAHPPLASVIDAQFKVRTGVSGGQAELDSLDAQKTAAKLRFPKE